MKTNFRVRRRVNLNTLFSFSCVTLGLLGILTLLPPVFVQEETYAEIDPSEYSLNIQTKSDLAATIEPTREGQIAVVKDTVTTTTTTPSGYKLYVSTTSKDTNSILLAGQKYNDEDGKRIVATSGTYENPSTLSGSSWGFAVAGLNNFDSNYESANSSSKFAAIPTMGKEQLIHTRKGVIYDEQTDVYYGINVNGNVANGKYETQITYTTISEASDNANGEINLVKDHEIGLNYSNEKGILKTSLLTNRPLGTISLTVGGKDATDIEIISKKPLELSFTYPEGLQLGEHNIELNLPALGLSYSGPKITIYDTMQSMTEEKCRSLTLNQEYKYVDIRDGKTYMIARLIDGNCWMTQNLDLDLDNTKALTSLDTDLNVNKGEYATSDVTLNNTMKYNAPGLGDTATIMSWTPRNSTVTGKITTKNYPDDTKVGYSWDPGEYWIDAYGANVKTACSSSDFATCKSMVAHEPEMTVYLGTYQAALVATYYGGYTYEQQCYRFDRGDGVLVTRCDDVLVGQTVTFEWYNDGSLLNYPYGSFKTTEYYKIDEAITPNIPTYTSSVYHRESTDHYKVGNYYNFSARSATDASNVAYPASTTYEVAENSICPRGWMIPRSESQAITANKDSIYASHLGELYRSMGLITTNTAAADSGSKFDVDPTKQGYFYALPMGRIYESGISYIGTDIRFGVATRSSKVAEDFFFRFTSAVFHMQDSGNRQTSYPVRCLVRFEQELKYDANGGEGTPATQTRDQRATGSEFEILPNIIPTNGNKTFLGWSEDKDAKTPSIIYDSETQTFNPASIVTTGTTLYAIWADHCNPSATTIEEAVCMQDMNDSVKASMTQYAEYQLMDSRDEKIYYITKMGDDQIWMTQNLDLNFDSRVAFTSENTDLNKQLASAGYDGSTENKITWRPSKNSVNNTFAVGTAKWRQNNSNIDNVWNPGDFFLENGGIEAGASTAGCKMTEKITDLSKCTTSTTVRSNPTTDIEKHYSLGNTYNWAAATATSAATTDYKYGTTLPSYAAYTAVENSICPKGWRLPQGRDASKSASEFTKMLYQSGIITTEYTGQTSASNTATLVTTTGLERLKGAPFYMANSGTISAYAAATETAAAQPAIFDYIGKYARYWTSSIYEAGKAESILYLNSKTTIRPQEPHNSQLGYSIRCVAR